MCDKDYYLTQSDRRNSTLLKVPTLKGPLQQKAAGNLAPSFSFRPHLTALLNPPPWEDLKRYSGLPWDPLGFVLVC